MKPTALLQLESIGVNFFEYCFNQKAKTEKVITAESLDFTFKVQHRRDDKKKERIAFELWTKKGKSPVDFRISIFYQYSFLEEKKENEKISIIQGAIVPQIISFLRGYLFAATEKGPFAIILPSVNVMESFKEKFLNSEKKQLKKK